MAWTRPTLAELITRTENDFSVKFFGSAAPLRRGVLSVLARVWAGAVYLLHLYLGWIYDQAFAYLASGDQLDRHGVELGIYRKAAKFATGSVVFSGTPGTAIPQETLLQDPDDSTEYQTTADAVIGSDGTVAVVVTALVAGSAGNRDAGASLSLVSPITGADPTATSSAGLSKGTDLEADEPYRARILYRKRNPPQGGAEADYIEWAMAVSPVTDAWVFPQFPEANSVSVRVANYDASPPVLTADEVADVLEYLTDRTRRPVTADVRVASVQVSTVNVTARIKPFTAAVKAMATTELQDLFRREGVPASTIDGSAIQNAMASASGASGAVLVQLVQDGVVVDGLTLSMNQVPVLGAVTFSALS